MAYSTESENSLAGNKRLIVLVSMGMAEISAFSQEVRWIALQHHRNVVYLALSDQSLDDLTVTRQLATLEALTGDPLFEVSSRQLSSSNWVKAIQSIYQPGDMVLCHAGQLAPAGFGKGIPLENYLSDELHIPVHLLRGYYQPEAGYQKGWWLGWLFWLGSLAILVGFSLVEFRVDQLMSGVSRMLILAVLLVFEAGLIYELNKFTG